MIWFNRSSVRTALRSYGHGRTQANDGARAMNRWRGGVVRNETEPFNKEVTELSWYEVRLYERTKLEPRSH